MRLVDADVLLNGLDSICVEKMNSKKPCPLVCTLCPLSDMLDVIENAPTVDAIPVEWIKKYEKYDDLAASIYRMLEAWGADLSDYEDWEKVNK